MESHIFVESITVTVYVPGSRLFISSDVEVKALGPIQLIL